MVRRRKNERAAASAGVHAWRHLDSSIRPSKRKTSRRRSMDDAIAGVLDRCMSSGMILADQRNRDYGWSSHACANARNALSFCKSMRSSAPQSLHQATADLARVQEAPIPIDKSKHITRTARAIPAGPAIVIGDLEGHTERTEMSHPVAACCRSQNRTSTIHCFHRRAVTHNLWKVGVCHHAERRAGSGIGWAIDRRCGTPCAPVCQRTVVGAYLFGFDTLYSNHHLAN